MGRTRGSSNDSISLQSSNCAIAHQPFGEQKRLPGTSLRSKDLVAQGLGKVLSNLGLQIAVGSGGRQETPLFSKQGTSQPQCPALDQQARRVVDVNLAPRAGPGQHMPEGSDQLPRNLLLHRSNCVCESFHPRSSPGCAASRAVQKVSKIGDSIAWQVQCGEVYSALALCAHRGLSGLR